MKVFLSLGSNIADRLLNLRNCIEKIRSSQSISLIQTSSIYETEPLYVKNQTEFLNMVIEIKTKLNCRKLLMIIKDIEKTYGRRLDDIRYGPRIIDIDILTFAGLSIYEEDLIIPHPKIKERKFVLEPWSEIAKDYKLPGSKLTIYELLQNTTDSSKVVALKEENVNIL